MPGQLLDALVVVLLHEAFLLVGVVQAHDALQQGVGEFQLAHFRRQHLAQVEHELVVAVGYELAGDDFLHLGAELFFAVHHAFAEHLVENLLVEVARHEAGDFLYLEAEVGLHFGSGFLVNLQQGGELGGVAVPRSVGVEHEHVVHFRVGEDGFLLIVLHVGGHHDGAFHLDAAFLGVAGFVQFGEQAFQHVLVLVGVHLVIVAVALGVHLHLVVHHLVGDVNRVVGQRVVGAHFSLELRRQGDVEQELELFHRVEVHLGLLLFVGQRFAQDVHLIVLDILIYCFGKQLVHFLCQCRLTVHFLHQAHRHHSLAESRHLGILTEVFQCFVHLLLIICFFELHSKQRAYFVNVL